MVRDFWAARKKKVDCVHELQVVYNILLFPLAVGANLFRLILAPPLHLTDNVLAGHLPFGKVCYTIYLLMVIFKLGRFCKRVERLV
jgi:hypothetical protein